MIPPEFRILVVDDEEDVLAAYRDILAPQGSELQDLEARLFGESSSSLPVFDLVCCRQAEEAVEQAQDAVVAGTPFAVVFLDVRMPPGQSGVWAARQIRKIDQLCNIVVVTAYSDMAPEEITRIVPPADKLLFMHKPFFPAEIRQFARALAVKWQKEKELSQAFQIVEEKVKERTADLAATMRVLREENQLRKEIEEKLRKSELELKKKNLDLQGGYVMLNQMFKQKEIERKESEKRILFSIHEMALPHLKKLRDSGLDARQKGALSVVEAALGELTAPFMKGLGFRYHRLTSLELHVANLIRLGKKSGEIAAELGLSVRTVEFHRDRIREKIGIKNKRANLRSVLRQIELELDKE